jgi:tetratricopeptide (TPR) repeat protein
VIRRRGPFLFLCLSLCLAAPAWAIKEWYDYYAEGQKLSRAGRYKEALQAFQEAAKLEPKSDLIKRTYGMEFIEYVPNYQMGLVYMKLGDYDSAQRQFNLESSQGAIKKNDELYAELTKQLGEIETARRERAVQQAREQIARLEKEATDLLGAKRYEEALTKVATALGVARELDPPAQNRLTTLRDRIRDQQRVQA